MITVFVDQLPREKVNRMKDIISKHQARLVDQGNIYELSFECENNETKRKICKEILKIKNE